VPVLARSDMVMYFKSVESPAPPYLTPCKKKVGIPGGIPSGIPGGILERDSR